MENIEIVVVTLADVLALQTISRKTFFEAFEWGNTPENMAYYLATAFDEAQLRTEIETEHVAFYFAKLENEVIGYMKITEKPADACIEIDRIYVLQAFHGKKVGQILMDKALLLAKEKQVADICLGVWEKNPKAIRFYEKNGFVAFDTHVFMLGDDAQTDIMMKKKLMLS